MTSTRHLPLLLTGRSIVAALACFASGSASAHSVWIEKSEDKLVVRFGEIGDSYEKSPGYLDELTLPEVALPVGGKIAVEKGKDFFLLKEAAPAGPVVISTIFPVMEKPATAQKPASARWPRFYARWQVAGATSEPVSTLDIVPGKDEGTATVFFKGKPLPDAELTLIQPGGKETDLKADASGAVKFTAEGHGLFVLTVAGHSETAEGTYLDKKYTVISHNSSLAWVK